jgi:hypothetical protein
MESTDTTLVDGSLDKRQEGCKANAKDRQVLAMGV